MSAGDMDVILGAKGETDAHVILFFVRQGRLSGRESYHLQAMAEDDLPEVISAFIKQYYSESTMIPKEILVENQLADTELIEDWLAEMRGSQVKITVPQKGDKKALLDMAKRDVIEMMKTLDERANNIREKNAAINSAIESFIAELQVKKQGLETDKQKKKAGVLKHMISPTLTEWILSAPWWSLKEAAQFERDYRRFKIRTVEGPNDFGSMQEVLYRRFKRGLQGDQSFNKMPDLILMDGGKPQVSAAEQVLKAMKIDIPVAGMVKDDKHRTRGLLHREKELDLKNDPVLFSIRCVHSGRGSPVCNRLSQWSKKKIIAEIRS